MNILFVLAASLGMVVLWPTSRGETMKDRVRRVRGIVREEKPVTEGLVARVGRAAARLALRFLPREMVRRVEERLTRAGRPATPLAFVAIKAGGTALALAYGVMVATTAGEPRQAIPAVLALFGGSLLLPEMWLSSHVSKRRRNILKSLPDVMDLLCVSVEAGLSFDGAFQRVAEKFSGAVAQEFKEYLKEVRLGTTRPEALRNLGMRTGVPELRTFTAALVQAEQLGVGIARVLRVQSEQMREHRRQRAEEQAMKIPIKILFPMVIFIFPAIFVVVLGPAVISMMKAFVG